jgi:hypothetical protein
MYSANVRNALLLATFAAAAAMAHAASFGTDEARAEAAQRNATAAQAAAMLPYEEPADAKVVRVTDTDSARIAASLANRRQAHESHRAEVLRAGAGVQPAAAKATDTDSARAVTGAQNRQQALRAEFLQYEKLQGVGNSNKVLQPQSAL